MGVSAQPYRFFLALRQPLFQVVDVGAALLETDVDTVRSATLDLLNRMKGHRGHVFNLGHGIRPMAEVDNVAALVDTVIDFGS